MEGQERSGRAEGAGIGVSYAVMRWHATHLLVQGSASHKVTEELGRYTILVRASDFAEAGNERTDRESYVE